MNQISNYVIEKYYNANEFRKFVEDETKKPGNEENLYELINGRIFMMSSPNSIHYDLSEFIETTLKNYFADKQCRVYHAPYDLFLYDKKRISFFSPAKNECGNVFIPDLMVVCDKNQRKDDGIHGAPDLVVEIVSKSSIRRDYLDKSQSYMYFGVKEYWIVDPMKRKIMIYVATGDDDLLINNYTFDDIVDSEVFDLLSVDFKHFISDRI